MNKEVTPVIEKKFAGTEDIPFHRDCTKEENAKNEAEKLKQYELKVQRTLQEEDKLGAYKRGMVYTNNFALIFSSKTSRKTCSIPADPSDQVQNLTVHQRQAITEALGVSKAQRIEDIKYSKPTSTNYLLINIGCVISDKVYKDKKGDRDHKKIFITAPIFVSSPSNYETKLDSENLFVNNFLNDTENFKQIVLSMLSQHDITPPSAAAPRKIYALIFDMHSSQDVCTSCEAELAKFELDKRLTIKNLLKSMGFVVDKDEKDHFKIIFRVSSSNKVSSTDYRDDPKERADDKLPVRTNTHTKTMDLKYSDIPLILHTTEEKRITYSKWYFKESYVGMGTFRLPKQSVFRNHVGFIKHVLPETLEASTIKP